MLIHYFRRLANTNVGGIFGSSLLPNAMDIQRLLTWVCFIICLGLTVGGVMVFFRLRERASLPAVRLLQYYLVMMYAFGFYALWSDVLLRLLFPLEQEAGLIPKISNFLTLLGAPFLLIGLIMLALWS
ncbi:MAG: hypothetical protein WBA23_17980, partial [Tunicatimonas sp.]|uniref:hypothetical protein n=1 Tax=Tunicatimonas sp. TaxID=1940096 RepID=UPI003C76AB4B